MSCATVVLRIIGGGRQICNRDVAHAEAAQAAAPPVVPARHRRLRWPGRGGPEYEDVFPILPLARVRRGVHLSNECPTSPPASQPLSLTATASSRRSPCWPRFRWSAWPHSAPTARRRRAVSHA